MRKKYVSPYRIQHVLVKSESRLHRRCNKGAWSRISLALSMECFLISLPKLHFPDTLKHSSCNRLALSLSYFFWQLIPTLSPSQENSVITNKFRADSNDCAFPTVLEILSPSVCAEEYYFHTVFILDGETNVLLFICFFYVECCLISFWEIITPIE